MPTFRPLLHPPVVALLLLARAPGLGLAAEPSVPAPVEKTNPAANRAKPAATPAVAVGKPAEQNQPTEAPKTPPTPQEIAAREHFFRGVDLYTQGSYAQAWLEFSSAYRLSPKTLLLNNLARCEAKIGRPDEAVQHYKLFIEAHPDDPDSPKIRQEIARLENELARRGKPAPETIAPDAQPASRRIPAGSLVAGGVTVGLLAAGIAALGLVNSRFGQLQTTCASPCPTADVAVLERQAYAGYGLLAGAGAAAAVTGVLLYVEFGRKTEAPLRPVAQWRISSPNPILGSD